jgi:hypothetical protein
MQCGENADGTCTVSTWEWLKIFATSLVISIALSAVGAAGIWLITRESSVKNSEALDLSR